MPRGLDIWRALLAGALLALWGAAAADCADGRLPARIDARAEVVRVYDGDTVKLADGRKLRLIGVNAPELGHGRRPDDPFGPEARDRLREWLAGAGNRVALEWGEDKYDHYGRLLAHVYLPDGRNLQWLLVNEGLAAAVTVPPNGRHADCLFAAEARAREARRGIWRENTLGPLPAARLPRDARGFRILRGRITAVHRDGRATRLMLDDRVAVLVYHDERRHFPGIDLARLKGREVEVRGWLSGRSGLPRLRLRHADNLTLLGP